jgi:hypothetical protein
LCLKQYISSIMLIHPSKGSQDHNQNQTYRRNSSVVDPNPKESKSFSRIRIWLFVSEKKVRIRILILLLNNKKVVFFLLQNFLCLSHRYLNTNESNERPYFEKFQLKKLFPSKFYLQHTGMYKVHAYEKQKNL